MDIVEDNVMSNICVNKRGQATVTIPRAIFEAMGWKHRTPVNWKVLGFGKLKLETNKDDGKP